MEPRIVNEILKRNEQFLRRHLVLSKTVLDKLHNQGLITDIIRRKILMYPAHKQVPLLLESLQNRGLPSLRKFLEVLRDTGHRYLADTILDTEAIPVSDVRPDTTYARKSARDYSVPLRQTHTVHSPVRGRDGGAGGVVSLAHLFRMRQDREAEPRGEIVPRTLLADPVAVGYAGGAGGGGGGGGLDWTPGGGSQYRSHYAARREDIPATLYSLGQVFTHQQKDNEQALVVLRQEEMAIKQLMEQNARDQQKVRRKQYAIDDMNKRLKDINARASDMYEPAPHPNIGRYRLAQLNQIPWSVDH
nr:hypothetical protein BaRGS_003940 [Batillaria attramentaria]